MYIFFKYTFHGTYSYNIAYISTAAFASLRSILLVELLGLEKLTNAFGLLLLFQGIAGIFGSPVAGKKFHINVCIEEASIKTW